jgi:putative chitobiose transport system permease protein
MFTRDSRLLRTVHASETLAHYGFLTALCILAIGPFVYLLLTSLQPPSANPFAWPPELPWPPTLQNYSAVLIDYAFPLYALNSLIVAGGTVVLNVLFTSLAGFALARLHFPGRQLIFYAMLTTLTLPFTIIFVPLFVTASRLHLTNSFWGAILPFAVDGFSIFLFRQAFLQIPMDLEDAARMDGANTLQIYWQVMVPLVRPTVATVMVFSFNGAWNNFLWPLAILKKDTLYTMPLGLARLQGLLYGNQYQLAAGSVLVMLPVIIVYLLAQRNFVRGLMGGATKG